MSEHIAWLADSGKPHHVPSGGVKVTNSMSLAIDKESIGGQPPVRNDRLKATKVSNNKLSGDFESHRSSGVGLHPF